MNTALLLASLQLTTVQVSDTSAQPQVRVPVTFGQVFSKGHVRAGDAITARYRGAALPLQAEVKATHDDGSARHVIISTVLPQLGASETASLALETAPAAPTAGKPAGAAPGGLGASVRVVVDGVEYRADAAQALRTRPARTWLSGALANEVQVDAPLAKADGSQHPHLAARFAIRAYAGAPARIDITLENNWAHEASPQNYTYDAEIRINGKLAFRQAALTHYHHARWRKVFWTGAEPRIHLRHDIPYLLASGALPNYDQAVVPSSAALEKMRLDWHSADKGPMATPLLQKSMGAGGGRPDIGLQHAWAAMYLLSMDARAREVTLGLGDHAGAWPIHYRDRATGEAVSIEDYPYARTFRLGSDSYNRSTRKHEDLPACTAPAPCATPYRPDTAHQPSLAYLPYLVTGDSYYLDELHFWANWNLLTMVPAYRGFDKGLVHRDEVRGQAWSLRTLGHAAYITPDAHLLKRYFNKVLQHNLDYYNEQFASGKANQLGFIDARATGYAVVYGGPTGANTGIAPWQDDFFTSAVGHLAEMGFTSARPILEWKARFPVGRMMAPGFCWIDASVYALMVRPGAREPYFSSLADAWQATFRKRDGTPLATKPCASRAQAGEMTGYPTSQEGFPSHLQPALAMAAGTGVPQAREAWQRFINRSVKPDYSQRPQFAIVPR